MDYHSRAPIRKSPHSGRYVRNPKLIGVSTYSTFGKRIATMSTPVVKVRNTPNYSRKTRKIKEHVNHCGRAVAYQQINLQQHCHSYGQASRDILIFE